MSKHIFDKVALKNTENLSSHNFSNNYTLGIGNNNNGIKINDDASNEEIIKDSSIEGVKVCEKEENKLKHDYNKDDGIKIDELPIFPNLSE